MRIGPVSDSKTTNLAGLYLVDVSIPSNPNLQSGSWVHIRRGLNEHASLILSLEQFVAEEADRIAHCEENSHSQGKPCANQDKAKPHRDADVRRQLRLVFDTSLIFLRTRWSRFLAEFEARNDPHPNARSWNVSKWLDALSAASDG